MFDNDVIILSWISVAEYSLFYFKGVCHCDKFRYVPMTEDEMAALRLLLREELRGELNPFRVEVSGRLDEIASHIEGLYQRDERARARILFHPRTD